jgi:hypothetical protein
MLKHSALIALAAVAAIGLTAVSTSAIAFSTNVALKGVVVPSRANQTNVQAFAKAKGMLVPAPGKQTSVPAVAKAKIAKAKVTLPPPIGSPVPKTPPIWGKHKPIHVVRPVFVGGAATAYAYPVATYAAARRPNSCLTKEYLPNGAVLFKDVCTNEYAANPPLEQAAAVQTQ